MNKKIILLLWIVSASTTQSCAAAGYFKMAAAYAARGAQALQQNRAAQFLWKNKLALTGTGIAAYEANWYVQEVSAFKKELSEAGLNGLKISPEVREKIEKTVAPFGVKKVILSKEPDASTLESARIGDLAVLLFGYKAQRCMSADSTEKERAVMEAILKHELTHIEKRHSEKQFALSASLPVVNFSVGAAAYKGIARFSKNISDPKKKLAAHGLAAVLGTSLYFVAKEGNVLAELAYCRNMEREADEGVFKTGDRELIKAYKESFLKTDLYLDPWYFRTHPTDLKRREACSKALTKLDRLKNGNSDCAADEGDAISFNASNAHLLWHELLAQHAQKKKELSEKRFAIFELIEKLNQLKNEDVNERSDQTRDHHVMGEAFERLNERYEDGLIQFAEIKEELESIEKELDTLMGESSDE